ncbi:type VI secretion system contractile sheath small subunit [Pseudomonas nicosulfuronedens]
MSRFPTNSGQKFVARNRAPRVQIEYDVEIYGSEKKIQLPFVMGVMADLLGKPTESPGALSERRFMEIDIDNFDERMKSLKPRAAFQVENTLNDDDSRLNIDITFQSIDDFEPGAIARKVEPLNRLLQARTELSNLLSYMDGKSGVEDLLAQALDNPALLKSLVASSKPVADAD